MAFRNHYLFVFLIITGLCKAQNEINWQEILKSELPDTEKSKIIDSIITSNRAQKTDSTLERITHKYAIWLYGKKQIDKAISTAKYSLEIKKKYYSSDTTLLQLGLNNLAFFHYKDKKIPESIQYYEDLLQINSTNEAAAAAYSQLGRCYKAIGDYYKSIAYFELAQSLFKKENNSKKLISNAINANESYIKLDNEKSYVKGFQNLLLADSLSNKINSRLSTRYNIKLSLANLYNQGKTLNPDMAIHYYNEALHIAEEIKDSNKIAMTYGLLGNLYNIIDHKKAVNYQKKAISYVAPDNTLQLSICYWNIAYCLVENGNFEEGIDFYFKTINSLTSYNFSKNSLINHPDKLYKTPYKSYLLSALEDLANAYLKQFEVSKDQALIKTCITTFLIADELTDIIRIESREFQSKLYWRKQSANLYGKAIEACFLAKDFKNGFYFMEKNKALLLSEDINNSKVLQSLSLPAKLVDEEIELKRSIYILENKKSNNKSTKEEITIKLLHQKGLLKKLQDSIQKSFPEYSPINIQGSVTSLGDIQKGLDDQTIIFEYNISEHKDYGLISENLDYVPIYSESDYGAKTATNGYVLCISKNDVQFLEIENTNQLQHDVSSLVQQASVPFRTKEDISLYKEQAYKVFNALFPSSSLLETIKNKKVVIVPDNYLNYLPFEALVTSLNQKEQPNYLIKDCEISYTYSNSFLQQIKDSKSDSKNSFLAFAPLNFDTYDMAPLENSVIELSTLTDHFDGKAYTEEKASKATFLSSLSNHNIIHLATHANAMDSISPWIAFSDQKLVLEELYLTQNKADLVVLSGCNTLQGKQETGEGVMSLARGFFHAGAKSVVSSLWSIDDRSTAYIMNEFYKNLEEGHSKAKSLRMAKLNYLQNHSLSEASPHFWATFVLSGNTNALQSDSPLSLYSLLLLIPVLVLIIFLFSRRKR